ncbi:RNA-dependent RNA polymerase [Pholiota conissans]|uniref:RNA-dependent RNA polymerase n=1 Tax=Pholiota conissans TaxID=109636 RepID=A0A9P5Z215_9AGAR|nr:RNA-dependent RNA polymerase [Pholiota conissans]
MEIFMSNVNWNVDLNAVRVHLANHLHSHNFQDLHPTRMNFHVHLFPDRRRLHSHAGKGILTLPDENTGNRFLELFGSKQPRISMQIHNKQVWFTRSTRTNDIRRDVVEMLMLPYMDPYVVAERQQRVHQLERATIPIRTLQFGWECRDYVFSVECEYECEGAASLAFNAEKRELRITLRCDGQIYHIAISHSQIREITAHEYLGNVPAIVFTLHSPPTYECDIPFENLTIGSDPHDAVRQSPLIDKAYRRRRLSFLPIPDHQRVCPYASLVIRLICSSAADLHNFRRLSHTAQLHRLYDYEYATDYRGLFSSDALEKLESYLAELDWCIVFQIESIVHGLIVDVHEMLDLMPDILRIVEHKGSTFTANLLRKFGPKAQSLFWDDEAPTDVRQCFHDTLSEVLQNPTFATIKPAEGSLCEAYHLTITPTTIIFDGPFPERSNRVIRAYDPIHQEAFLRVSFLDEAKLQYRFDREVDPGFIRDRVGPFLLDGLVIANREFKFLAYSQSALKEHAVWFVTPFRQSGKLVDADSIIKSLGKFDGLQSDPELMYCPARYAARISQAFTATDAVEVEVEEILLIDDILTADQKYVFTDGVGTMSPEIAGEIWSQLRRTKRRGRALKKSAPSAYQIRLMGTKGMLSTDYKLRGLAICTRPSMTKFEASRWTTIEIARAFDRPGIYYLNRPLIMLLEGLGIPYNVFKEYQDQAVEETRRAGESLAQAAHLFESYGLGSSFRLPSVMLNLDKLGITVLPNSPFYAKMIEYGINHVLRDLKNHARIPIPGAWTLVGVADVHRYLQPGEIFACIKPVKGDTIYLEGPILISRSPTIHPGDAMIVNAVGRPRIGSCFAAEPIPNTVVFSERPIPSCLGGGDLDGDVYNLIPLWDLPEFTPTKNHPPARYDPAPKKKVDHPSTMDDVADFVMEYIISDVVGMVAINWLLIADQSEAHILDPDCMKLADLHSNAVDYPKSGQPVPINEIPRPKFRVKPDWHAPETVDVSSGEFYESRRAIGRLFRAIDLPIEHKFSEPRTRRRNHRTRRRRNVTDQLSGALGHLDVGTTHNDPVFLAVEDRVQEYIDTDRECPAQQRESILQLFGSYTSELRGICLANNLSHSRTARLSEEEAVIGTIVQKTSQRRKRKDAMATLRENTDFLVRGVREELAGDQDTSTEEYLERSWIAWEHAFARAGRKEFGEESFGVESFAWVALGAIFDALREIEERQ